MLCIYSSDNMIVLLTYETPRGRNHNLDTRPQIPNLPTLGHSAVHDSVLDFRAGSELVAFFLDLNGKLSGGGEDEDDGTFARLEILLCGWVGGK